MYRDLGYPTLTYAALNNHLNALYDKKIEVIRNMLSSRSKKEMPVIAFDKWTGIGNCKYIGLYLYALGMTFCLGLIPYSGFCGHEQIRTLIGERMQLFGLTFNDISVAVTDGGADVRKAAESTGIRY